MRLALAVAFEQPMIYNSHTTFLYIVLTSNNHIIYRCSNQFTTLSVFQALTWGWALPFCAQHNIKQIGNPHTGWIDCLQPQRVGLASRGAWAA